jgi:Ser/Thr protein kinase RdoA (MazF antagonist)
MPEKKYDTFTPEELATCLSHYDLGVITSVKEFHRGSRRAPKSIVECERGRFLFKRRQKGPEAIQKVAFTHQIQLALAAQSFPLPHLLGTRTDNNSLLVLHDHIYEMQEYIVGTSYDGSMEATYSAGHALGLYHKLLEDFQADWDPPTASYHNAKAIHQSITKIPRAIKISDKATWNDATSKTVAYLGEAYRDSAKNVNTIGIDDWPGQIVHGDWHPGNMLFREKMVAAVIDYDTARLQQRVIDLAYGALQFSIIGGGEDPLEWPRHPDMKRFCTFLEGYDAVNVITTDELDALPYLMCEAMIAEALLPIASTGGFGRFDGAAFLTMIRRKVEWIYDNIQTISGVLNDDQNDEDQGDGDDVQPEPPEPSEPPAPSADDDPLSGLTDAVNQSRRPRQ